MGKWAMVPRPKGMLGGPVPTHVVINRHLLRHIWVIGPKMAQFITTFCILNIKNALFITTSGRSNAEHFVSFEWV